MLCIPAQVYAYALDRSRAGCGERARAQPARNLGAPTQVPAAGGAAGAGRAGCRSGGRGPRERSSAGRSALDRCAPRRAKRRRVVPGRRRRGRVAGVAKGRETRSRRRQHAERIRHAVKPFAQGVAKPEQLRRSELVAKPLPERGVPGQQRLSPRSESVRRQEPPDGFTSDTRHSWVQHWRRRWSQSSGPVAERLADAPRPGTPATFSAEQICAIVAMACEAPGESARPITHWTHQELADEALKRGIVASISPDSVGRFLKKRPTSSRTARAPG